MGIKLHDAACAVKSGGALCIVAKAPEKDGLAQRRRWRIRGGGKSDELTNMTIYDREKNVVFSWIAQNRKYNPTG